MSSNRRDIKGTSRSSSTSLSRGSTGLTGRSSDKTSPPLRIQVTPSPSPSPSPSPVSALNREKETANNQQDEGGYELEAEGHSGDQVESFVADDKVNDRLEMDPDERTSRLLEINQLKLTLENAQESLHVAISDLQEGRPRTSVNSRSVTPTTAKRDTKEAAVQAEVQDATQAVHVRETIDVEALADCIHESLRDSLAASVSDVVMERMAAHLEDLQEKMTEQMDEMEKTIIQSVLQIESCLTYEPAPMHEGSGVDPLPPVPEEEDSRDQGKDQVTEEGVESGKKGNEGVAGDELRKVTDGAIEPSAGDIRSSSDDATAELTDEKKDEDPNPTLISQEASISRRSLSNALSARLEVLEERTLQRNQSSKSDATTLSKSLSKLTGLVRLDGDAKGEDEREEERLKQQREMAASVEKKQLEIDALKSEVAAVKESFDSLSQRFGQQAKEMEVLQVNMGTMMQGIKGLQQQQQEIIDAARKQGQGQGCCVVS